MGEPVIAGNTDFGFDIIDSGGDFLRADLFHIVKIGDDKWNIIDRLRTTNDGVEIDREGCVGN